MNVDSKAEYSALSGTRSQKKKLKQRQCPFNTVQVKIREVGPEGISGGNDLWRKGFVKEMSFKSGVKGRGSDRW